MSQNDVAIYAINPVEAVSGSLPKRKSVTKSTFYLSGVIESTNLVIQIPCVSGAGPRQLHEILKQYYKDGPLLSPRTLFLPMKKAF